MDNQEAEYEAELKRIDAKHKRVGGQARHMALRDWFAGQALAGYMVNVNGDFDWISSRCYEAADAMIKERNKTNV